MDTDLTGNKKNVVDCGEQQLFFKTLPEILDCLFNTPNRNNDKEEKKSSKQTFSSTSN